MMNTLRASFFLSHVGNLDLKEYSKFSCYYTGPDAAYFASEATDSFFRRALKRIKKMQYAPTLK